MSDKDEITRYSNRGDDEDIDIINIEFIFLVEISANRLDLEGAILFITEKDITAIYSRLRRCLYSLFLLSNITL